MDMADNITALIDISNSSAPVPGRRFEPARAVYLVFLGVLYLVGLSNLIVIYAIIRNRNLRSVTNIYIVNLAIADMLCICTLPISLSYIALGRWPYGPTMCKVYWTLEQAPKYGSVLFLTVLSIDRYLAICLPVKSIPYRTQKVACLITLTVWVGITSLLSPVMINAGELPNRRNSNETMCQFMWSPVNSTVPGRNGTNMTRLVKPQAELYYFFCTAIFVFVLPAHLMLIFYTMVLRRLSKLSNRKAQISGSARLNSTSQRFAETTTCATAPIATTNNNVASPLPSRGLPSSPNVRPPAPPIASPEQAYYRNVTKMIFVVIIVHILCWTPAWILNGLSLVGKYRFQNIAVRRLLMFLQSMPYINSAINPILYGALNANYRHAFQEVICCVCIGYRNIQEYHRSSVRKLSCAPDSNPGDQKSSLTSHLRSRISHTFSTGTGSRHGSVRSVTAPKTHRPARRTVTYAGDQLHAALNQCAKQSPNYDRIENASTIDHDDYAQIMRSDSTFL